MNHSGAIFLRSVHTQSLVFLPVPRQPNALIYHRILSRTIRNEESWPVFCVDVSIKVGNRNRSFLGLIWTQASHYSLQTRKQLSFPLSVPGDVNRYLSIWIVCSGTPHTSESHQVKHSCMLSILTH